MSRWFTFHDNQPEGPFSLAQLQQLIREGRLRAVDEIQQEGPSSRQAACSLQGLFVSHLDRANIPREDCFPWQPRELVAVLGEHCGRHWGPVYRLAFMDGNKKVASVGDDGVRLWEADTLQEILSLEDAISPVIFSDNDQIIYFRNKADPEKIPDHRDTVLTIWDLQKKKRTEEWLDLRSVVRVTEAAFSSRGQLLAVGGQNGRIWIWNLDRGCLKEKVCLEGSEHAVSSIAFSRDGKALAAGTANGQIWLWSLSGPLPRNTRVLDNQPHEVTSLVFCSDDQILATASRGSPVCLWTLDGRVKAELTDCNGRVTSLGFDPTSQTLAAGLSDGHVHFLDMTKPIPTRFWTVEGGLTDELRTDLVTALAFSPDGEKMVISNGYGALTLSNLTRGMPLSASNGPTPLVESLAFSPNGEWLVSSDGYDSAILWNLCTTTPSRQFLEGSRDPLAFSPDGKTIAATSDFNPSVIVLWNCSGEKPLKKTTLKQPKLIVTKHQKVTSATKDIPVLGLEDNLPFEFGVMAFCSDNQLAIASRRSAEAGKIWFLDFNDHQANVTHVATVPGWPKAFSSNGRFLIAVVNHFSREGEARRVQLWDLSGGQPTPTSSFKVSGWPLALSLDGKMLAAAGENGNLLLLETTAGNPLLEKPWHFPGLVHSAAFDYCGRYLATGNANGTLYILRIPEHPAPCT
jgi:WD40 repeat protein